MPDRENDQFVHLGRVGRGVAAVGRNPRIVAFTTAAVLVLTSWAILLEMGAIASRTAFAGNGGPDSWLMRMVPDVGLPSVFDAFFALCLGTAHFEMAGFQAFLPLWAMWSLMAAGMMLPSAAPMIGTYCDIAEAAGEKDMPAVHPVVLLAGYLSAWALMAAVFAGLALTLNLAGATTAFSYPIKGFLAPVAISVAGIYQFTAFRNACLEKCRNPFSTLFAQWNNRARTIFVLGIRQGAYCVGCCWALMLVMFVVGTMNIFWMALLTMFSLLEKTRSGSAVASTSGVILLVWAAALMFIHY